MKIQYLFILPNIIYDFISFTNTFDKTYDTYLEYYHRSQIYNDNINFIQEHNKKNLYQLEINEFGDMTNDEFKNYFNLKNLPHIIGSNFEDYNLSEIPDSINWVEKGAVTDVKNQGQCGSCWAFSTTGAIEGSYYLQHDTLLSFSEQYLVDCSSDYGNYGCRGGLPTNAYKYIEEYGIGLEKDYKYSAIDGNCKDDVSIIVKLKDYVVVQKDEKRIIKALLRQPLSIAIAVSGLSFQFYKSGIYENKNCGEMLNHAVLLVGFGTENGQDYFLVKNSWGPQWGDKGYIKMIRHENTCGMNNMVSYPIL